MIISNLISYRLEDAILIVIYVLFRRQRGQYKYYYTLTE